MAVCGLQVYRKTVWTDLTQFPDNSLAEDYAFAESAIIKGATLSVIDNSQGLQIYLRHRNTWQFDLNDYRIQVTAVPMPSFIPQQDQDFFDVARAEVAANTAPSTPAPFMFSYVICCACDSILTSS